MSPSGWAERACLNPKAALVRRPLTAFLDGVLVLDQPRTRRFVTTAMIEQWNTTPEDAWNWGLQNLDPTMGLSQWSKHKQGFEMAPKGAYSAGNLLFPRWLSALEDQVEGTPLAAIPHGEQMMVVGTGSLKALALATHYVGHCFVNHGSPISPLLYQSTPQGLTPWMPRPGHMLHEHLSHARAVLAGQQYAAQARALLGHTQLPLGRLFALRRPSLSDTVSCACWPNHPVYLPRAQVVVLAPDPKTPPTLALWWDDAVALGLVGDPHPTLRPARYPVGAWPTGAARAAATKRSINPKSAPNLS